MPWISWMNVALGLWLVVSAFVFRHATGAGIAENVIAGLFVALMSIWAARAFNPLVSLVASWVVVLNGLWVLAAPFVLQYEVRQAAVVNDVVVGVAIVALGARNTMIKANRARPAR